jgi:hypothetical protein
MRVLLVVDRAKDGPGIWAMAWTSADDDPKLLESKHFLGDAALKVWLGGIVTRYGRSNITVDWKELRGGGLDRSDHASRRLEKRR